MKNLSERPEQLSTKKWLLEQRQAE